VRGINNLKVLTETTFDDYPDASIEAFVRQAIKDHDELTELFRDLVTSTIVTDGYLLARPDVYNKIVKILNESM